MFAYSMREKTHAHRTMMDTVPQDVKSRRLQEIIAAFRTNAQFAMAQKIGMPQTVLVESRSEKNPETRMCGRTDGGHKVEIFLPTDNPALASAIKIGTFVRVIPFGSHSRVFHATPVKALGHSLSDTGL